MLTKFIDLFRSKTIVLEDCDHLYFPVLDPIDRKPIGQQCCVCHQFNTLEQVNAAFEAARIKGVK